MHNALSKHCYQHHLTCPLHWLLVSVHRMNPTAAPPLTQENTVPAQVHKLVRTCKINLVQKNMVKVGTQQ